MARRGFFAELQRQVRIAQREQERRVRDAAREQNARVRHREQTAKAAERAYLQHTRTEAAQQKRLERAAREAHIAAKEAEVEERNQELSDMYADIDALLESTLSRDDYVDLTALRVRGSAPAFRPCGPGAIGPRTIAGS